MNYRLVCSIALALAVSSCATRQVAEQERRQREDSVDQRMLPRSRAAVAMPASRLTRWRQRSAFACHVRCTARRRCCLQIRRARPWRPPPSAHI